MFSRVWWILGFKKICFFLGGGKYVGTPKQKFLFCQTSLLCIVGEWVGEWSVAVAVAVAVGIGDTRHMTPETWHMTCDCFFLFLIAPNFVLSCINARWEIHWLPNAGFLSSLTRQGLLHVYFTKYVATPICLYKAHPVIIFKSENIDLQRR